MLKTKAKKLVINITKVLITDDERYRLTVEIGWKLTMKFRKCLVNQFSKQDSSMSIAVLSGARGSIGQVKMTVGTVGIQADTTGRAIELPIRSNYKSGLNST